MYGCERERKRGKKEDLARVNKCGRGGKQEVNGCKRERKRERKRKT